MYAMILFCFGLVSLCHVILADQMNIIAEVVCNFVKLRKSSYQVIIPYDILHNKYYITIIGSLYNII